MFQFTGFPLPALCVQAGVTRHDPCQVFPFGDPRIKACLAAPRGLSQPATSFIGFQRQGIHRVPFATCRDDARARYGVLKGRVVDPVGACVDCSAVEPPGATWFTRIRRYARPRLLSRALPAWKARVRSLQSCTVCPTRPATVLRPVMTAKRSPRRERCLIELISQ